MNLNTTNYEMLTSNEDTASVDSPST